jgi:hypothetical protein
VTGFSLTPAADYRQYYHRHFALAADPTRRRCGCGLRDVEEWCGAMLSDNSFIIAAQHFLLDSLVILFLVSGTAKLLGHRTFRFGLQLLPFMTAPVAAVVSIVLPIAELVLAIFLFLNFTWAKIAAIGLLVLFTAVALFVIGMKRNVPCGCFGQLDGQNLSWWTVVRNTLLILIVVVVLGMERRTEWMLSLLPTVFVLLAGLSIVRIYQNQVLISGLRKAKVL